MHFSGKIGADPVLQLFFKQEKQILICRIVFGFFNRQFFQIQHGGQNQRTFILCHQILFSKHDHMRFRHLNKYTVIIYFLQVENRFQRVFLKADSRKGHSVRRLHTFTGNHMKHTSFSCSMPRQKLHLMFLLPDISHTPVTQGPIPQFRKLDVTGNGG